MSTTPPEFDYVDEYKAWRKEQQLVRKAEDQSMISYLQRFDIKRLCGGKMAVVHSAIERLADLLQEEAFREEVFDSAGAIAELYPLVRRAPRHRGLRVELWAEADLKLQKALAGDGFRCVSASGCIPQVYYGDGVPERYRDLIRQPDTVSLYVADGVVRGRAVVDGEGLGVAEPASLSERPVNSGSAAAPDGDPVRRRALRAAAARVAEAQARDTCTYETPPVGALLHKIVETEAAEALLGAIIRREGEPDAPAILRHLRGSFGLGHMSKTTKEKVMARLAALCSKPDFAIDEQGRYRALTPMADPPKSLGLGTPHVSRFDTGVPGAEGEHEGAPGSTGGRTEAADHDDPSGIGTTASGSGGLHETSVLDAGAADRPSPEPAPPLDAADR